MKRLLIISIVLCVSGSLYAQNKTIKGRIISNQFDVLIGVPIMIRDTVAVGKTDINGFFQIEIPVSDKKISFRFVGVDPATIELADQCHEVEVIMMLSGTYDFTSLKKVDRLRMKKFKKLPELHQEAFEKGLFKTDKPCYTQEFIPFLRYRKNLY